MKTEELIIYDGNRNYYNCIYLYVNNINGKKYVGKAKDLKQRHEKHLRGHLIVDKQMRKYGVENFTLYVIVSNLEDEEIDYHEKYYIKKYNTYEDGYNYTLGGTGGNTQKKWTDDRKQEFKKKMSEVTKGDKNPMYGKKASEELRDKISESHKGLTYPTHRVTLAQYDLHGNLIKVWYNESATNVSIALNIHRTGLVRAYNKGGTCGGFMWKRVEKGEEPLKSIEPYKRATRKR